MFRLLRTPFGTNSPSRSLAQSKPFDKILIANRGEIAMRVIKTAKKMGIRTVAIFSEADVNALHVRSADERFFVGPPPSSKSYLVIPNVIEAIKSTGAQAVHPGYGFLSENSHFVEELEKIGVTFVGPPSSAMHAMGDKIESKKIAKAAGVNIIPGFLGEVHNNDDVLKIANEIGYPVMVKASAGGGGKGMRVAWNDKEAIEAFRLSRQEAASAFGDDRILIEKYIDRGRHIEIQVLCDGHGNAIYLNERECSIQRRNQKVVEEAPSPFLDPKTRAAMGKQACTLAREVGYVSAGTVEFLVDQNKNFYFLEMNTRLQVEHPITEMITNIDIVEWMLRIAAGEKLALTQQDIGIHGWAIESRVYAEDPLCGFLPSIGSLRRYNEPSGEGVRVDSGVYEGGEISMYYDPLISKLATHGDTRAEAIERMERALDDYVVGGVTHNINFLRAVMGNEKFRSGDISTKFIPEEFPKFEGIVLRRDDRRNLIVASAIIEYINRKSASNISGYEPSSFDDGKEMELVVNINSTGSQGATEIVRVRESESYPTSYNVKIGDKEFEEVTYKRDNVRGHLQVEDKLSTVQVLKTTGNTYQISFAGTLWNISVRTPRQQELYKYMKKPAVLDTSRMLLSPMAGSVVSVAVKEGDKVVAGQEIAIIEAMKMQNILRAERDGVVEKVAVQTGSDVSVDQVLVNFAKQ